MGVRKILVVEDDVSVSEKICALLESIASVSIARALNRIDAEAVIGSGRFDLAIVDIQLGTSAKDRYAGLKLLTLLDDANTVVIIISGVQQENLREVSLTLSAYDFIGKPIIEMDFINKVERALAWAETREVDAPGTLIWPEGLSADPKRKGGFLWQGSKVQLSITHQRLVQCLVETPGRPVSRTRLAEQLKTGSSAKAVASQISLVRRAFRDVDAAFDRIKPDPGNGYVWTVG